MSETVKVLSNNKNSAQAACSCTWKGVWYIEHRNGERLAAEEAVYHASKSGHILEPRA